MSQASLDELIERFNKLKETLEAEFDRILIEKQEQFAYTLQRGKVIFEQQIRQQHKQQRVHSLEYILGAPLSHILTAPIIYAMVVPLVFLDISLTLYQHICFRAYGTSRVVRGQYICIDRHHLAYLNSIEKFNCIYCGYGNGLMAYAGEIISKTEQFWCPIKHASRIKGQHKRYDVFFDYGDAETWKGRLDAVRDNLKRE
jgi:hypothetical protein